MRASSAAAVLHIVFPVLCVHLLARGSSEREHVVSCAGDLAQRGSKLQAGGHGTVVAITDERGRQVAVKYIPAHHKRAQRSEVSAVSAHTVAKAHGTRCSTLTLFHETYIAAIAKSAEHLQHLVSLQLQRLDNSHPHIVHTHGMLRGASGSVYIMQERAVCDLHDAAGACGGRVMGEGEHVKEWMLQVAHGKC